MIALILGVFTEWKGSQLTRHPFQIRLRDVAIALILWPLQIAFMLLMVTLMWGKRGHPREDSK